MATAIATFLHSIDGGGVGQGIHNSQPVSNSNSHHPLAYIHHVLLSSGSNSSSTTTIHPNLNIIPGNKINQSIYKWCTITSLCILIYYFIKYPLILIFFFLITLKWFILLDGGGGGGGGAGSGGGGLMDDAGSIEGNYLNYQKFFYLQSKVGRRCCIMKIVYMQWLSTFAGEGQYRIARSLFLFLSHFII